jgi:hypothetical protein
LRASSIDFCQREVKLIILLLNVFAIVKTNSGGATSCRKKLTIFCEDHRIRV